MPLDPAFQPLMDAVNYVMADPGGMLVIAALTEANQNAEQLTIAPPSSLKAFRAAENKAELLNIGLVGNSHLKKKISPEAQEWLVRMGWARPQEPFNPHYSVSGRKDLDLGDLLERAVESWVRAYEISPNTPFIMNLSKVQQDEIAAKYLTLDPETFVFTLPGFESNIEFEKPKPRTTKPKKEKEPEPKKPATRPSTKSKAQFGKFTEGDQVSFQISAGGDFLDVTGTLIGEKDGKARVQVAGHKLVPDNIYPIPWTSLK